MLTASERSTKWNNEHREHRKIYLKKYQKENKTKYKMATIKYLYGISKEQYDKMYVDQNGLCAICSKPETMKYKNKIRELCVDHNHTTGKIRKLLCYKCNLGLGCYLDNPELLKNAANYLEQNQ